MQKLGKISKEEVSTYLAKLVSKDKDTDVTFEGVDKSGRVYTYGVICASPFEQGGELPELIIFGSYEQNIIKVLNVAGKEDYIEPFFRKCISDLKTDFIQVT